MNLSRTEVNASRRAQLDPSVGAVLAASAETLGGLEGSIVGASRRADPSTLLMTSSRPGEGKTLAALHAAHGLALERNPVLLIDANIYRPQLSTLYGLQARPGLADYLNGQHADSVTYTTEVDCLSVMPVGVPAPGERAFVTERLAAMLQPLTESYRYVVADSGCVLSDSWTLLVAPIFDAVVLVVRSGTTRWETLERTTELIGGVEGRLIGCVLNRFVDPVPPLLREEERA